MAMSVGLNMRLSRSASSIDPNRNAHGLICYMHKARLMEILECWRRSDTDPAGQYRIGANNSDFSGPTCFYIRDIHLAPQISNYCTYIQH